jgi:hypothetical protein
MRYTLWLDGHLLGETRLEHRNPAGSQRMGGLHPTPYGMEVLPGMCGFLSAAAAVKGVLLRHGVADPDRDPDGAMRLLEQTSEGSRFTKVVSALARLELRQSGGERAAFHTIIVTDIRELSELSGTLDANAVAAFHGPRFIVSATPIDLGGLTFQLRSRLSLRARLEPN